MAYLQNFKGGEEQKNLQWKAKSTKNKQTKKLKAEKRQIFFRGSHEAGLSIFK